MRKFTDSEGAEWEIVLNIAQAKRLRDELGLDIVSSPGDAIQKLSDDPITLADALAVLCRDQIKAKQLTSVRFGEALAGDAIDRATDAFMEELVNFTPGRRREILAAALAKARECRTEIADETLAAIRNLTSGSGSIKPPAPSESSPTP